MYYDGCVHIEEDDQCFTCEYYLKGVSCPLLEALAMGVVELQSEILVRNCGFYQKFERHLKVVDFHQGDSDDAGDGDQGRTNSV